MSDLAKISVIGLGKLGLCMAACFAGKGHRVIGVDIDQSKINKINRGISPVSETGLASLISGPRNRLTATRDYEEAIRNSDVSFIVVATPSLKDGSFSNAHLEKALKKIGAGLKRKNKYHLIVITSTVMPQTTVKTAKSLLEEASGKKCGRGFGLVYNPEFIALGSVIRDFLKPDLVLLGQIHKRDGDFLEKIYRNTCANKPVFVRMSPLNAEIAKLALNCYITTKITFANSLAALCEKMGGANARIITDALGMDSRVGKKYIRPGLGYGGPCFPRDNAAFSAFARALGERAKLAESVEESNQGQAPRVVKKIKDILSGVKKSKDKLKIAILGLAYKPETSVIDCSQALAIASSLVNQGYRLSVYDPQALDNARKALKNRVRYARNKEECINGADLAVIAVPWREFQGLNLENQKNQRLIFLDCWGILRKTKGANIKYLGVG